MERISINKTTLNFPIFLGYQYDHNARTLAFDLLDGNDNFLKLKQVNSSEYEVIPLENNEWIISSSYTIEPRYYQGQLMKKVNGSLIENSQIFEMYVKKSIGGKETETEIVPPNFKTAYDTIIDTIKGIIKDKEEGKFKGDKGFSPTISVEQVPNGIMIYVTGENGTEDYFIDTRVGTTSDYNMLANLPNINGVKLVGNKTAEDLLLQHKMTPLSNQEIEKMFK